MNRRRFRSASSSRPCRTNHHCFRSVFKAHLAGMAYRGFGHKVGSNHERQRPGPLHGERNAVRPFVIQVDCALEHTSSKELPNSEALPLRSDLYSGGQFEPCYGPYWCSSSDKDGMQAGRLLRHTQDLWGSISTAFKISHLERGVGRAKQTRRRWLTNSRKNSPGETKRSKLARTQRQNHRIGQTHPQNA
jgi:hypothetical protein